MNIFLLVDNYEDCVIGIVKTEMDYNDFGKELLKFAVGKIDGSVYTISKEHDFYLKHNFKQIKRAEKIPALKYVYINMLDKRYAFCFL